MSTQITMDLPKLHVSSTAARRAIETDPFEGPEDSTWISPGALWEHGDVGFVDHVLRLIVGRNLFGPEAGISFAWCGEDYDATRVDRVQLAIAVPGLDGVHLTSAIPVRAADLTPVDAGGAVDCAVGIYEAVAACLEGLLRPLVVTGESRRGDTPG